MTGFWIRSGCGALLLAALAGPPSARAEAPGLAICFEGSFVGYDAARQFTTASLFSGQSFPVMGQFVRRDGPEQQNLGLSLKITLEERVGVMLSAAATPDNRPAREFATSRYEGEQRLKLTSEQGRIRNVRWALEPVIAAAPAGSSGNPVLELVRQTIAMPLIFDFSINPASNPPVATKRAIDGNAMPAGRLTITAVKLRPLQTGCPDWAFEAVELPDGFEPVEAPRPVPIGADVAISTRATPDTR